MRAKMSYQEYREQAIRYIMALAGLLRRDAENLCDDVSARDWYQTWSETADAGYLYTEYAEAQMRGQGLIT